MNTQMTEQQMLDEVMVKYDNNYNNTNITYLFDDEDKVATNILVEEDNGVYDEYGALRHINNMLDRTCGIVSGIIIAATGLLAAWMVV